MSAALDVRELRKQFVLGRPAVDGVSFHVAAGEIVVLLGPSGCGKTTTLRCVAGLEHATAGRVSIGGRLVSAPADGVQVPLAPAQHRHGVPVLRGLAAHDGEAERGLSAPPPPRRARRDRAQGRRDARAGRPVGIRAALGGVALGRADATGGARAQPGLPAAAPAPRRATEQSRRAAAPAAARRLAPHHQADRGHRRLRHPRPGRSRGARRPHRRHARRQAVADGVSGRDLQSAGRPVRRQLHRRLQSARGPSDRAQRRVRHRRRGRPPAHGADAVERQGG